MGRKLKVESREMNKSEEDSKGRIKRKEIALLSISVVYICYNNSQRIGI